MRCGTVLRNFSTHKPSLLVIYFTFKIFECWFIIEWQCLIDMLNHRIITTCKLFWKKVFGNDWLKYSSVHVRNRNFIVRFQHRLPHPRSTNHRHSQTNRPNSTCHGKKCPADIVVETSPSTPTSWNLLMTRPWIQRQARFLRHIVTSHWMTSSLVKFISSGSELAPGKDGDRSAVGRSLLRTQLVCLVDNYMSRNINMWKLIHNL